MPQSLSSYGYSIKSSDKPSGMPQLVKVLSIEPNDLSFEFQNPHSRKRKRPQMVYSSSTYTIGQPSSK